VDAAADLVPAAEIGRLYLIFGGASLISLVAFVTLILAPALGSYERAWEKAAAGFLSLFVLAALVLVGIVLGIAIVLNYDQISDLFSQG
jgi:hypothetical protein